MQNPIVIVAAKRTPIGQLLGELSSLAAPELGGYAIAASLTAANLAPEHISEVIMGCVLSAGLGQAGARQAALKAGLPLATPCTTVNKMCGSGMKAVMLAHDQLLAHPNQIIIAGGMESMSNAPYLVPKARPGYRLGHGQLIDHMLRDGLEDAYETGTLMGVFADRCATQYQFTRQAQDDFALASLQRAQQATTEGWFKTEISPISLVQKKQTVVITTDEGPRVAKPEKIKQLSPAFSADGTVTAANSSSISDGAAALILMRKETAKQLQLPILATIMAQASHAQAPEWFTTAPIEAIRSVLTKANWTTNDVDLFEINEAFAVVAMVAMRELKLAHERVNIHGGACVLGHPIGASGARILTTLIYALLRQKKRRGVAALCIGGGEATAMAIEIN